MKQSKRGDAPQENSGDSITGEARGGGRSQHASRGGNYGRKRVPSTWTKKELVSYISQEKGIHPNDVRNIIQAFLDAMTDVLSQGARIEIRDFGVFEVVQRRGKIGRNPKKASIAIKIPPKLVVKFSPGKRMKDVIESESPNIPAE